MSTAWAIVLSLGGLVFFGYLVFEGMRRGREIRQAAASLNLNYAASDDKLALELEDSLPMFSKGEIVCADRAAFETEWGRCYFFRYSYYRKKTFSNRNNSESVGLTACMKLKPQFSEKYCILAENAGGVWQIEYSDRWLGGRRKTDSADAGYSGEQLREYYTELNKLLGQIVVAKSANS